MASVGAATAVVENELMLKDSADEGSVSFFDMEAV